MPRRALPAVLALALAAATTADDEWTVPPEQRARANPVPASPLALAKGRALFQKHCASCHGDKGKGDGQAARYGTKPPRDLTDSERQRQFTDGEAFWKITVGRREGADVIMPAFAAKVPAEDDRWKLVLYLRTLDAARSAPR